MDETTVRPGVSPSARLLLAPAPQARGRQVVVGMLCQRADRTGSVVASPTPGRGPNAVVAARAVLRRRPSSPTLAGSVRVGQPVTVVGATSSGRWLRVRTDDGQRGWLRAGQLR